MNGKLKRPGTDLDELEEQIDKYFDNNTEYSIEMLYQHLGVTKANVYDGGQGFNGDKREGRAAILLAKDAIHSDLAHEIKMSDKLPMAKLYYLRNRFKDDLLEEKSSDEKVVINIGNSGPNALIADEDEADAEVQ